MKPKTLLALTLVVAALVAFVWFVERDLPSSEERAEQARLVLPVTPEEVAAVAIDWGGESVRLERAAGGDGEADADADAAPPAEWRLAEPFSARADRAAVDTLLDTLGGLRKVRTLEAVDRAAVGLDAPRGSVEVTTGNGERRLLIGAAVPGTDNVVVGLDGSSDAWVTSGSFLAQLERSAGEWRSRDVLTLRREEVTELRLRTGDAEPTVLVERGGRFHVAAPFEDLADGEAVDRLLADIATLRAARFLDRPDGEGDGAAPDDATLGLAPPRATIEAIVGEGEPVRIELGAPVTGDDAAAAAGGPATVYARVGGQRFEAVTGLAEAVGRPAGSWRSPAWTALRSFEIDRIEIEEPGGAGPLVLVRSGVDWRRGEETIPYTAASDLLFALTEAEGATADVDGLASPVLTVRLAADEGDAETLELYAATLGADDGEGPVHPARSSARSSTLLLGDGAVAEVLEALAAVRAAEPETQAP